MKREYLVLCLALLAGLACNALMGGGPEPLPDPIEEPGPVLDPGPPTDTPEPAGPVQQILYEDDFSNPLSGWDRASDSDGLTDYADGAYRIHVTSAEMSMWANPNQSSYTDVRIEVDSVKTGGTDDNAFGVICRHADLNNFYAGIISSDGYFGLLRRVNAGDLELIGQDNLQTSAEINQGATSNHIRLDCVGSRLSLYVNGQLLAEVDDPTIASGDVGLYASTFDTPDTEISFDDFVVYQPE
jgi:hypothetical protein